MGIDLNNRDYLKERDDEYMPCEAENCDGSFHDCPNCDEGSEPAPCFEDSCGCNGEGEHGFVDCPICGGKGQFPCPLLRIAERQSRQEGKP